MTTFLLLWTILTFWSHVIETKYCPTLPTSKYFCLKLTSILAQIYIISIFSQKNLSPRTIAHKLSWLPKPDNYCLVPTLGLISALIKFRCRTWTSRFYYALRFTLYALNYSFHSEQKYHSSNKNYVILFTKTLPQPSTKWGMNNLNSCHPHQANTLIISPHQRANKQSIDQQFLNKLNDPFVYRQQNLKL